jgi:hypothetical protein
MSVRVAASAAAVLLATGIGLGVTSAVRGSVPANAQIPLSPAENAVFVEDDNGAGAGQRVNILQSSARGVVSIISARGVALGTGFVITRSGFALAAYHGLPGAGRRDADRPAGDVRQDLPGHARRSPGNHSSSAKP